MTDTNDTARRAAKIEIYAACKACSFENQEAAAHYLTELRWTPDHEPYCEDCYNDSPYRDVVEWEQAPTIDWVSIIRKHFPAAPEGQRERFEAWATAHGFSVEMYDANTYIDMETRRAWFGWQACAESTAQSPAIPDGWVLVPRKMEVAMMDAGQRYIESVAYMQRHILPAQFRWVDFWEAMLSSAPTPPSPAPAAAQGLSEIYELREKNAELEALFDLQWKRMGEATERWRAAHPGKELTSPDLGALLTWLLQEIDGYKESLARGVGEEIDRLAGKGE